MTISTCGAGAEPVLTSIASVPRACCWAVAMTGNKTTAHSARTGRSALIVEYPSRMAARTCCCHDCIRECLVEHENEKTLVTERELNAESAERDDGRLPPRRCRLANTRQ